MANFILSYIDKKVNSNDLKLLRGLTKPLARVNQMLPYMKLQADQRQALELQIINHANIVKDDISLYRLLQLINNINVTQDD